MKKVLLFLGLVFLLAVVFFTFSEKDRTVGSVYLGEKVFKVEVADTSKLRTLGLSGHEPLSGDEGMFFVFEKEGVYGFWMKDMLFPIDIIWIDKNFIINHIESEVLPGTYPKVFAPKEEALYVLELQSGEAKRSNIKIGDSVKFIKK